MKILFCTILAACLASTPLFSEQMRIMVTKFTNNGTSAEYDWIAAGVQDSVLNDFKKIKDVLVITAEDRRKAMNELTVQLSGLVPEAQQVKVGEVVGANVILAGSYSVNAGKIRVMARLVKVVNSEAFTSVKIDGDVSDIFGVQDRIVFGLVDQMGAQSTKIFDPVKISDEEKGSIGKEKLSLTAYELYSRGLDLEHADLAKSLSYFEKAIEADPGYIEALGKAAATARLMSDWTKSKKYLDAFAKSVVEKYGENSAMMAEYYFNLGSLYLNQFNFKEAEKYLPMSLNLREKLGLKNTVEYAKTLINFGNVFFSQGKTQEAFKRYEEAKGIAAGLKLEKSFLYAALVVNFASLYLADQKYDKALPAYEEAQKLIKSIGLEKSKIQAEVLHNVGEVYVRKKEFDKAEEYKKNALAMLKELGQEKTAPYAHLLHYLGVAYASAGKKSLAIDALGKAQTLREELNLQKTRDYLNADQLLRALKK